MFRGVSSLGEGGGGEVFQEDKRMAVAVFGLRLGVGTGHDCWNRSSTCVLSIAVYEQSSCGVARAAMFFLGLAVKKH